MKVWVAVSGVVLCALAVVDRAGAGDPEKGKTAFAKCAACHTLNAGLKNELGPTLEGVIGRKAGSRDDFRYSPAMKRSGIVWTPETIDAYVADPQGYIKNNRMPFEGIKDKTERQDLMAYLEVATKASHDSPSASPRELR